MIYRLGAAWTLVPLWMKAAAFVAILIMLESDWGPVECGPTK